MRAKFRVRFSKTALKDYKKHTPQNQKKVEDICKNLLQSNPSSGKKLVGKLAGVYSIRLNLKDRIVYEINPKTKTVLIHRTKTYYGE